MADSQRKTANLFDESAGVKGYYINASGEEVASSYSEYEFAHTQKILVEPEMPYTYSLTVQRLGMYRRIIGYDENKNYIGQITDFNVTGSTGFKHITFTTPQNCHYITINYVDDTFASAADLNMMLNTDTSAEPYEPYGWVHSLRKLTTATEAVENPLYSDGTAITAYTIKGNTVQDGTPSPSNPVTIQGVGERTENLLNVSMQNIVFYNDYPSSSYNNFTINNNVVTLEANKAAFFAIPAKVEENTTYYVRAKSLSGSGFSYRVRYYSDLPNNRSDNFISSAVNTTIVGTYTNSITTPQDCKYILTELYHDPSQGEQTVGELMVSSSSDFEPYGFKIPISLGGVTTNIYLNEPLYKMGDTADTINADGTVTRRIGKVVLDGTENQWVIYEYPVNPPVYPYALYQIYSNNALSLGGVQYISCYSEIAPYGFTSQTRQTGDLGVYLVTNGNEVAFQLEAAKSSFPNVEAWTTYLSQKPVTVYYIKATPTTETVTAPTIPTTKGANTITVDTTVQPSEFTATWTGWHDSSVKEYDGTDWQ